MNRPTNSNADEWALFLSEYVSEHAEGVTDFLAVQIAEAIEDAYSRGRRDGRGCGTLELG